MRTLAVAGILVVALLLAPGLVSLYGLRLMTGVLMLAVVAQGINAMAGFVGYPAFGNVVFFGVGAYGTALGVTSGHPFPIALALGAALAGGLALVIGPVLLRLRGHYFAIATLGLNEVVSAVVANATSVTGGSIGLSLPLTGDSPAELGRFIYHCFVALFAVSVLLGMFLRDSRFGYGCRAIRANEEAADATGVPTLFVKSGTWILSALLTGVAGGLYARWLGFIEPGQVFDMTISVKAFVMFLLGGAGTVFGPLIGAALIETATTLAWSHLLKLHLMVLGITIMAVVLLIPDGAQSLVARQWPAVRNWWRGRVR